MDLYTFSLTLGGAGLLLMGLRGLGHGQADHGHDVGHAHGHTPGHGHDHGGHAGHSHGDHGPGFGERALSMLSPRVVFSFLLGVGTTGIVLGPLLRGWASPVLFALAVAGGLGFEKAIVGPLWKFLFRFESSPATTLDSAIDDEAKAITNFDDSGHGLISVEVDGQVVQCLGTLSSVDRDAGVRIRAGDLVRIEDVDAGRNRCTVRRV